MANIHGGGAATNKNGLKFEQDTSLAAALKQSGCTLTLLPDNSTVPTYYVAYNNNQVGIVTSKARMYKIFFESQGISYKHCLSKQIQPDDVFLNVVNKTAYILEKKFQSQPGSVDEKLQTCDFKKKQYTKLFALIGYSVEYIYVCNDWFKRPEYKDTIDYIHESGCHLYFNEIPMTALGLN